MAGQTAANGVLLTTPAEASTTTHAYPKTSGGLRRCVGHLRTRGAARSLPRRDDARRHGACDGQFIGDCFSTRSCAAKWIAARTSCCVQHHDHTGRCQSRSCPSGNDQQRLINRPRRSTTLVAPSSDDHLFQRTPVPSALSPTRLRRDATCIDAQF